MITFKFIWKKEQIHFTWGSFFRNQVFYMTNLKVAKSMAVKNDRMILLESISST